MQNRRAKFSCRFCDKCFARPYRVTRHERTHEKKLFTCQLCCKTFKDNHTASMHVLAFHEREIKRKSARQSVKMVEGDEHCEKTSGPDKAKHRHKSTLASGVDAAACGNYLCDCGLRFKRKRRIKQHQVYCQIHTNRVRARESLNNESQQEKKHKKSKSSTSHEFRCDRCSRTFRLMDALQKHKRRKHKRKKVNSDSRVVNKIIPEVAATTISSSTADATSSTKLASTFVDIKTFGAIFEPVVNGDGACSICGKFLLKRNLAYHRKQHILSILNAKCQNEVTSVMQVLYLCRYKTCHRAFLNKQKLMCHEVDHSGSKPFMCDLCDKQFETSLDHEKHVSICMLRLKENACWYCGKFLGKNSDLTRHEDRHVKKTGARYVCGHCSEHAPTRPELNLHHLNKHQNLEPRPKDTVFQCRFCSVQLPGKSRLLDHVQATHWSELASTNLIEGLSGELTDDEKEWGCKLCGKIFDRKIFLTEHEKIHTTAPFKCHRCNRSFLLRMALQRHSVNCTLAVATSTAMPEEATKTVDATKESDEDVISISSSSPSPPPSPEMQSIQIQRLKPVPVKRPGSTGVHHQFMVSTNDDCAATPSSPTGSIAQPRDQIYLIQYSSEHTTHGPLTISLPDINTSRSAIRVLPEGESPAVPIPVKLERVL